MPATSALTMFFTGILERVVHVTIRGVEDSAV
jgi:hypothetical protein